MNISKQSLLRQNITRSFYTITALLFVVVTFIGGGSTKQPVGIGG